MNIQVLSDETINQIAAGEVVERPLNIVKELLENAIDAGASAVAVEIRDGGTSLIRITDNGCGIAANEVRTAFLRHATSKIRAADDLMQIQTLGFRGEALASIAAVSSVELITKQAEALLAVRLVLDAGAEQSFEEVGAPNGTTILVRRLFYNVPARKKFLKSPATEAAKIQEIVEMEALAHPEISFKYLQDGRQKLATLGNGQLKDVIYAIYGREVATNLIPLKCAYVPDALTGKPAVQIEGFVGKPMLTRNNRNFEISFVNGRFVKNQTIMKALEDGYRAFLMQHRFPFAVLKLELDPACVDVNVHPQKMEVRFSDGMLVYNSVCDCVTQALSGKELIAEVRPDAERSEQADNGGQNSAMPAAAGAKPAAEPFEQKRAALVLAQEAREQPAGVEMPSPTGAEKEVAQPRVQEVTAATSSVQSCQKPAADRGLVPPLNRMREPSAPYQTQAAVPRAVLPETAHTAGAGGKQLDLSRFAESLQGKAEQESLFAPAFLSEQARVKHRIVGQLFDTYWLVEYDDRLYIIDQHAAHEKVMFERMMRKLQTEQPNMQYLNPPILLTMTAQEAALFERFRESFEALGYEINHMGERDYSVSAVPAELPGIAKKELLLELLDQLTEESGLKTAETVYDRIASMSCKAAVKGGNRLSLLEADALISELLSLENPYACPHGRPTIISMSRTELEKKFKRIV